MKPLSTKADNQQAGLLDIDEVKPFSDSDRDCFAELREVLKRHNALDRFGITLLHSHFALSNDETLIEFCDTKARTMTIRALKTADLPQGEAVATQWRLDTGAALIKCTKTRSGHVS